MDPVTRPEVVVLDVNETLSDLAPLADRFAEVGAPPYLMATWFAGVLRDGFALTAARSPAPFAAVAAGVLGQLLPGDQLDRPLDEAVAHVMAGFTSLGVHPDVVPGIEALHAAGIPVVTLSNGSADVAEGLLSRAGVRDLVTSVLSVEQAGAWKPDARAYAHALEHCGVRAQDALLVAVHPWDVHGARRNGLAGAWIDRAGGTYPPHFLPPTLTATGLDDLARQLA